MWLRWLKVVRAMIEGLLKGLHLLCGHLEGDLTVMKSHESIHSTRNMGFQCLPVLIKVALLK